MTRHRSGGRQSLVRLPQFQKAVDERGVSQSHHFALLFSINPFRDAKRGKLGVRWFFRHQGDEAGVLREHFEYAPFAQKWNGLQQNALALYLHKTRITYLEGGVTFFDCDMSE